MSLETSYEVLEMLRDDGVQTFHAKERATGRDLELHLFLPFGRPENKALFEKLKNLPLTSRRKFLDIGVDGSTPYLVTDPLPGGRGFKGWAEELLAGPSAPTPAAAPSRDDGVQILQAGQWKTGTPLPGSLIMKPAVRPPQPPKPPESQPADYTRVFKAPPMPPPANNKPGEFTALFQTPEADKPASPDLPPPTGEFTGLFRAVSSPIPQPSGAGEFTKMFQAPPEAAISPVPPPREPEPPAGGGEFTKYFENPLKPAANSAPRPTIEAPPPPPPSPQAQQGGDFTKVFGKPNLPQAPSPPPPQANVFGAMPSATGAFSPTPSWSQPQALPNFQAGPSEYTKMMGAPAVPTLGQSGPPFGQAPAPQPPAKKSNLPLFIALGVVIVLLIAIVVFLFMRTQAAK